ncbi:DUF6270 domain-containing protein [Bacillus nitroreducens]
MKKSIGILGSCVTRDVFDNSFNEGIESEYEVSFYTSKSSLISIESNPIYISEGYGKPEHRNFFKRVLQNDFEKGFFNRLTGEQDIFIIDFIDERYDCFEISPNQIVTRSDYLLNSGILDKINYQRQLYRVKQETIEMWKESCDSFLEKLLKVIPRNKIVLHKAYYAKDFRDVNGEIKMFDGTLNKYFNQEEVEKHNNLLSLYYDYVLKRIPGIKVIDISENGPIIASREHKWGLAPFHYEKNYYEKFKDTLKRVTQDK